MIDEEAIEVSLPCVIRQERSNGQEYYVLRLAAERRLATDGATVEEALASMRELLNSVIHEWCNPQGTP